MQPQPWMTEAKCADMDPTLFDWQPESISPKAHTAEQLRAAQLCDGCPVMRECARFAYEVRPSETIYAGIAFPALERDRSKSAKLAYQRLAAKVAPNDPSRCKRNHLWADNTVWKTKKNGNTVRTCRQCQRDAVKRSDAKRRANAA